MIRIWSTPRSAWARKRIRCLRERPMVMKRLSSVEWSGSGRVSANGSVKTVLASSNETPCFLRFDAAFFGSHR